MITKKQIESMKTLGMTFLAMFEADPLAQVDMGEPSWNLGEANLCGSPACHAGWFAVARNQEQDKITKNGVKHYNFHHSAKEMAVFLGFDSEQDLENWAFENPTLWGNTYGGGMFSDRSAFLPGEGRQPTLKEIGKHWLKVASRCESVKAVA